MAASLNLGDLEWVLPAVYPELRRAAQRLLDKERRDHTLQPTALVNEALLRLGRGKPFPNEDPKLFIFMVVREMRRELTDHARKAKALKRSWHLRCGAPEDIELPQLDPMTLLVIDAALEKLQKTNPRAVTLIELRFFGGFTEEEIAAVLGVTTRTVQRTWLTARKWLYLEMSSPAANDPGVPSTA